MVKFWDDGDEDSPAPWVMYVYYGLIFAYFLGYLLYRLLSG